MTNKIKTLSILFIIALTVTSEVCGQKTKRHKQCYPDSVFTYPTPEQIEQYAKIVRREPMRIFPFGNSMPMMLRIEPGPLPVIPKKEIKVLIN